MPSRRVVVSFRCNIDEATNYTHDWCEPVLKALEASGLELHDYAGTNATPRKFRDAIRQHNPSTIIIFDHGSECDLYGEDDGFRTPILGLHNAYLTEGRIILTLACSSAAQLGPTCVRTHGCLAYVGYKVKFRFYSMPPYLDGFRESAIEFFLKLASGQSLAQAHGSATRVHRRILRSWKRNPPDAYSPLARAAMMNNMNNHLVLGDKALTIT